MFETRYPRISWHPRWCRGWPYLLILIVYCRLFWELLWKITEFRIICHGWSINPVLLHLIYAYILSPQLIFHEEPRYFFIRHLCCLMHLFLILYLRLLRHVICIVLYVMLSVTLRERLTLYLTLCFLFFPIPLFLLRLTLLLLVLIFNALIQQVFIYHDYLLYWLVTVPLLFTRIINYQSLFLCEETRWVQLPTVVWSLIAAVEWWVRPAVGLSVSGCRGLQVICLVDWLGTSESSG